MNAQQLRNSILQQAIQGKLVPQDPTDEPASVLLQRIRKEKERLVKEGKLKKKDLESKPIEEDEIPFEIPKGWEWVRLGFAAQIARGGSPRPIKDYLTDSSDGINWIKIGDTDKGGKYINSCKEKIKPEGLKKTRKVHPGDFLLTNSMSYGRPYITNIEGCIHDGWLVISPFASVFEQSYLYYVLSSPFAFNQFSGKVAGAVVQNLNSDKVADSAVPLPPLAEQRRIVAKIEELMPLVERYGKAQQALDQLNESLPARLRQSILLEAIQGRLVPQNPKEEPASELLKRIRKEKERLVKEGKLKKKDLESKPIEEDEIPFEIPESWEWCIIGDLFAHNNGKQLNKGNARGEMMDYITTSNLYWEGFVLDKLKQMPFEDNEIDRCQAIKGDLLVCEGGDIGRAAIWNYDYQIMLQNHLHKLRAYVPLCTEYFRFLFYYYNKSGMIGGKGIGIQGFSSKALHNTLVPLPPLSEQKSIVAKVEELFGVIKK